MAREKFRLIMVALAAVVGFGSALAVQPQIPSSPPALIPLPKDPPPVATTTADACCHLAAASVVVIELANEVGTKLQKRGDRFAIRLAEPIVVNGHLLIPAGATGGGEVVDAARGGLGGRPGKLILAARYLIYSGVRVPLRGFRLAGTGRDNGDTVWSLTGLPYVGIFALAIPGGDVVFPAGTRAIAKIASDTDLTISPAQAAPPLGTNP